MRETTSTGEIRALTGLRGVAACFVLVYHYFQHLGSHGRPGVALLHGYLSVDLFFVLSGFVMALTYARTFAHGARFESYRGFIFKRLARVYPLYFVATMVGYVLARSGGHTPSLFDVLSNLLLVNAWGAGPSVGGPTWSISTEFAAYLAFPVMVAVILQARPWVAWCAALIAVAALVLVATRSGAELNQDATDLYWYGSLNVYGANTPYPLLRCLAGFTLGMLAFRLAGAPSCRASARNAACADACVIAIVILLFVRGSDVLEVMLFVPLVIALSHDTSIAAKALRGRLVHWLGLISYSIYLTHVLLDHAFRHQVVAGLDHLHVPNAFTLSGLVLLPAVILVSAASYYGIEKPARIVGRRLIHSRHRPIATEPSAP